MSTSPTRGPRLDPPPLPTGTVQLQAPPDLQPHEGASALLMTALPMLGSVGSIVFVAASSPGPRGYLAAGMFLLASAGFVAVNLLRQRSTRQTRTTTQRREYLRYLGQVRATVRDAAQLQRRARLWSHPDPAGLPALAHERTRVWERAPQDPDFLHVRYALTAQPLALELVAPAEAPVDLLDPVSSGALRRLLATHRVQPDLPEAADLGALSRVEVTGGSVQHRHAAARALICSAAAFHSPEQLLVAVLSAPGGLRDWEWMKWLPHAGSPRERDAAGPARMVATDLDVLVRRLPDEMAGRPRFDRHSATRPLPHVLLVLDGVHAPAHDALPEDGVLGLTVLDLSSSGESTATADRLRLHLDAGLRADGRAAATSSHGRESVPAHVDQLDVPTAEAFARRLAPLRTPTGPASVDATGSSADLLELLGLGTVSALSPAVLCRPRPSRDQLRVPIGVGPDGEPVHLDLKEAAQQGMGPHGLVIGATGSGKSELLRTLVLALTLTHSPAQLNLVLVDFKGGATFAGMSGLPHVSAMITNLEAELTLVDRMQDALSGELTRRQELLRRSGHASARDYERARGDGPEPLPSLLVVVDEFSELLSAKPEFVDLFVTLGRLGRSLGVHLLLASQRLEEGRLRGLDSHLSYRIGLRTFSAAESRTVLGVPDAHELASSPGLGLLRPDSSTLLRFRAAYVSGPASRPLARTPETAPSVGVLPFTLDPVVRPALGLPAGQPDPERVPVDERSVLEVAVAALQATDGPAAHPVWLPPLDDSPDLRTLLPDLTVDARLGLVSAAARARGQLTVPIGIVDRPADQRRDELTVELAGAGGHVGVVGAPRSGKSTALRTLLCALALTNTPREVSFYVLDLGGGTFAGLRDLPHVAGIASRNEPDVVRRTVAEVGQVLQARERYFAQEGLDAVETYRSRRAEGLVDDGYGDVFLVVDGWGALRGEFEELERDLQHLTESGLTYGVHLLTSAAGWSDYRAAARDLLGTRIELRLGDPLDSQVDRKLAVAVPAGRPGRGVVPGGHHVLLAQPVLDDEPGLLAPAQGQAELVEAVRDSWTGPPAPQLRLLPSLVTAEDLQVGVRHPDDRRLVLGVDERALAPVTLDVDAEPHLLLFGDAGSGKSALLRAYLRELARTRSMEQAQVVLVDYRRALLGEVAQDRLVHHLTSSAQAGPALTALAGYLRSRLPGPDVTPQQIRTRAWWSGADVFVVVDDYDLVTTSAGSPVQPLLELLPQATDIGLHLVLARRSGGAGRALYEPVVQTLRDLAAPALLLSGSPEEGPLVAGHRARALAPGRAQLVTRDRGTDIVQLAWHPPAGTDQVERADAAGG